MKKGMGNTTYGHLFSSNAYLPDPYDLCEEGERVNNIHDDKER